jgi:hypothetical protein
VSEGLDLLAKVQADLAIAVEFIVKDET